MPDPADKDADDGDDDGNEEEKALPVCGLGVVTDALSVGGSGVVTDALSDYPKTTGSHGRQSPVLLFLVTRENDPALGTENGQGAVRT